MLTVDAHLDLSYNGLRGRAVEKAASQQVPDEEGTPSVGLPDLRAAGVQVVCGTIFCQPASPTKPGYHDAEQARSAALAQLDWYGQRQAEQSLRLVKSPGGLKRPPGGRPDVAVIVLMEGADPMRGPMDVAGWFDAGLRIVGLAWKGTRFAGGTGAPGPLTAQGVELLQELDRYRIIHDVSHLAEESFWQLLDKSPGAVMASHSNCRSIVPGDRQISDEMIRAVAARGGVIGISFHQKMLLEPSQLAKRRATLNDVVRHVGRICDLTGTARHVGLGTDMDGGFGRDQLPVEIETSGDLPRVAEALAAGGFSPDHVQRIMGRNWMEFFAGALPE